MELNWNNAEKWIEKSNNKKDTYNEPKWSFDCGFKLDFDGSIISVNSRFYPPNKNSSKLWEGSLSVVILGEQVMSKDFKEKDLDKLKEEVEKFLKNYSEIVKSRLK